MFRIFSRPPPPHSKLSLSAPELAEYQSALAKLRTDLKAGLIDTGAVVCDEFDLSRPKGTIPELSVVEELCRTQAADPRLVLDYLATGCTARAHLFAKELRDRGLNVEKMFVCGNLGAENHLGKVSWKFHVAPLVFVRAPSGEVVPRVVDLSLASEPLHPVEWIKKFNQGDPVVIELAHRKQPSPVSFGGHSRLKFNQVTATCDEFLDYLADERKKLLATL
jgi:hypothetical protein